MFDYKYHRLSVYLYTMVWSSFDPPVLPFCGAAMSPLRTPISEASVKTPETPKRGPPLPLTPPKSKKPGLQLWTPSPTRVQRLCRMENHIAESPMTGSGESTEGERGGVPAKAVASPSTTRTADMAMAASSHF